MTPATDRGRDEATPSPVACRCLVCFAVKEEARFFQAGEGCRILIHGMGHVSARSAITRSLSTLKPRLVLTCGFAGALDPALALGSVLYELDDASPGSGELSNELASLEARRARFHGSDRVAVLAREKHELRRFTGADAVEMESSVIRAVCRERQLPAITLRVISDVADEDLPLDFNQLMTPEGGIRWTGLARELLMRPSKVPQLIQLQKNSAFAARRLGQVLQELLGRLR